MAVQTLNRRKWATEPSKKARREHWIVAGHYDPEFVQFVESELDRLGNLPANWDHYGSPRIDPTIVSAAKAFTRALPEGIAYRPRVVPMSPGNLQLEWHHGEKVLELEFESPQTIRYLQWDPKSGVEEEDSFSVGDKDRAVDLIQWFMSGTCV